MGAGREELDEFEDGARTAFIGSSIPVRMSPHSTGSAFYKRSSERWSAEEDHSHFETEGGRRELFLLLR